MTHQLDTHRTMQILDQVESEGHIQDFQTRYGVDQRNDQIRHGERPSEAQKRLDGLNSNLAPMTIKNGTSSNERGSVIERDLFFGEAACQECTKEPSDTTKRCYGSVTI